MLFHIGRTPVPTPTMTAASVAGDSFPPFYLGTTLTSTPDDDEAWVLQVPGPRFAKISTPTSHGTYHAVATHVENFPFLPLDNRRHEPNCSTTPAPAPSSFLHNSCSIATIDDAKPAGQSYDPDEGFSPIVCKCPFAFCRGYCPTAASLWTNPPAPLPRPTTFRSITSIDDATPNQQTIDQEARRTQVNKKNTVNLARLFPLASMPTITTPIPP